jgi:hypothetical protein
MTLVNDTFFVGNADYGMDEEEGRAAIHEFDIASGTDRIFASGLRDAVELQVGPEYGLAVTKDAPPAAMLLALIILSPIGQRVLADRGFRLVTLPEK